MGAGGLKTAVKKIICRLLAAGFVAAAVSCHLFNGGDDLANVKFYFDESNIGVSVGGYGSLSLRVEPPEALEYYEVNYEISNEGVARVYTSTRRNVVVRGISAGSTVITARAGTAEAKAVVNVMDD